MKDIFKRSNSGIEPTAKGVSAPGDYFCMQGEPGRFDNGIHRITAIGESLSVHVSSADALNGVCFTEYQPKSSFAKAEQPQATTGIAR